MKNLSFEVEFELVYRPVFRLCLKHNMYTVYSIRYHLLKRLQKLIKYQDSSLDSMPWTLGPRVSRYFNVNRKLWCKKLPPTISKVGLEITEGYVRPR